MTIVLGPVSATLSDLVREGVTGAIVGDGATRVTGVRHDSRDVTAGDLFAVIPGATHDGAHFVPQALASGAAALLVSQALDALVPQLVVPDVRRALPLAAAVVYGHPTFALDVIGVTGTNGKTTVTWLVEHALAATGHAPALIGTVTMRLPGGIARETAYTTPEADDLARFAREAVERGATHLVMEVSSHALEQHRADAVRFRVAAFTNLTQDHLDFHGTMEAYFAAKARLFRELSPGAAVICVDSDAGRALARELSGRLALVRVSTRSDAEADVRALSFTQDRGGLQARIATPRGETTLRSALLGAHNLENLLVALGIGLALDADLGRWTAALGEAQGAPGRLERVPATEDIAVFVDYAHTPDAVERALAALRPVTTGRLFVVLGCGGDRDRGKRPHMGEAAGRGADLVVVTSDNPRTEPPEAIVAQIVPGVVASGSSEILTNSLSSASHGYATIVDRRAAIATAIAAARPGDTVLIAGKGHEPYQIIGTTKLPFDDREEAAQALAARGGNG